MVRQTRRDRHGETDMVRQTWVDRHGESLTRAVRLALDMRQMKRLNMIKATKNYCITRAGRHCTEVRVTRCWRYAGM